LVQKTQKVGGERETGVAGKKRRVAKHLERNATEKTQKVNDAYRRGSALSIGRYPQRNPPSWDKLDDVVELFGKVQGGGREGAVKIFHCELRRGRR